VVPQLQRNVLVGAAQCVDGRASTRLGHLGDDARGTSSGSHDVGEGLERTGAFAVGRGRLAVVG